MIEGVKRSTQYSRWMRLAAALAVACSAGAGQAQTWDYVTGRGYVVCDGILKRLNSYHWTREQTLTHSYFVVVTYPGWKEPPWQDLDPKQHKALILELIRYRGRGADVYFGRKPSPFGPDEPQIREDELRIAFKHDVRLQVWHTRLISWLDEKPAPPTPQTVVQLRYQLNPEEVAELRRAQPDKPVVDWFGGAYIVTDDLRGPHPGVANRHTSLGTVLIFDGEPHFVRSADQVVTIKKDFGSGPSTFCELEFKEGGR